MIDCSEDCPGGKNNQIAFKRFCIHLISINIHLLTFLIKSLKDEKTLNRMGDMLDDVGGEFHKKYPVIAFLQRKLENQTQEEKDKSHENIVKLLTTCGFQNTLALLGKYYVETNVSPGVFTNPFASFRKKILKHPIFRSKKDRDSRSGRQ